MFDSLSRRDFFVLGGRAVAAAALANSAACASTAAMPVNAPQPFKISLAQWSFHRALQARQMDHLDFARVAREQFDIGAIEYVNSFFKDKARDHAYLAEMNQRAADHGVVQHLIMCDGEGRLGDPDAAQRTQAVENHYKWVDTARELGCITIRVNAQSDEKASWDDQLKYNADGLHRLCEYGDQQHINVIIENHGGLSSNGKFVTQLAKLVDHPRFGTLPDFGNFYDYDRYLGVTEMMPFAKAVSAKSHDFDDKGEETTKDYHRLMKIVTDAGYHSWVGIEYEGERMSEPDGVAATLRLLKTIQAEMLSK